MTPSLTFGFQSAVGHQHGTNEDALGSAPEQHLWFVADGMGGHAAGDVAAGIVRDVVLEQVRAGADLPTAIAAAHTAVVEAAAAEPSRRGMGSTVVALQVQDGAAEIAWVGDSRAYLLRDGALRCLTRDHSLVQWLLEQGRITPADAAAHPDRNVLVRTLGFEQPAADVAHVELEPDDVLLLCSDGLSGVLAETEIRRILMETAEPQAAADALVGAVVERQGRDDASAIVVHNHTQHSPGAQGWLPIAGGIGLGVLGYLIWNWMKAS